jgi:hypothetical protein
MPSSVSPLVLIALFGWIPVALAMFAVVPARRAVIVGFLVAWLFLPMYGLKVQGLPTFDKVSVTPIGVLLGVLIFDGGRFFTFRPRLIDLPVLVWCVVPFFSAVTTEWGALEGISVMYRQFTAWGIPYFLGRLYFSDLRSMRELAIGVFIGGLLYVPLCLYEIRMSPQLHNMVYGFQQHNDFGQTLRGGGYRPMVFMQHGLAVGTFMCTAAIIGVWLALTRSVRSMGGMPMLLLAAIVLFVAVFCKSTGATLLAAMGLMSLLAMRVVPTRAIMLAIVAMPFLYVTLRTFGGWDGQMLLDLASDISPDRADSLGFRLRSERLLWSEIQPYLLLGRGRFLFASRSADGDLGVTPDGLWVIALGCNGLVGVGALVFMMATPVLVFVRRFPARLWKHPAIAPSAVLATCFALYGIDCLFNAMENPILVLIAGGISGLRRPVLEGAPVASAAIPARKVPAWMAPPRARGVPAVTGGLNAVPGDGSASVSPGRIEGRRA